MKNRTKKQSQKIALEYGLKIYNLLAEKIAGDEDCIINLKEVMEKGHDNEFMHALINIAPHLFYMEASEQQIDILSFNHLANRLAFQFTEQE